MNHQKSRHLIFVLVLFIFVLNFSTSCFISKKYQIIPTNNNPKNPLLKNLASKFDTEKDLIVVPDSSFRLTYCVLDNTIYQCGKQRDPLTFEEFSTELNNLLKRRDISASLESSRNALSKLYDTLINEDIYFYGTLQRTKAELKKRLKVLEIAWQVTVNIWDARRNALPKDTWSSEPRIFALVADDFIFLIHGPKRTEGQLKDAPKRLEIFLTNPRPRGDIR